MVSLADLVRGKETRMIVIAAFFLGMLLDTYLHYRDAMKKP